MMFWRKVGGIIWKDIISEIRTRESISAVLVFTLLVIVVFNFAFGNELEAMKAVAPGILWVTFAFAGVLSLNRSFVMEREDNCIEGLMLCPINRETIYIGKILASLLFMVIVEAIALPIFSLLFNIPVLSGEIILVTFLATVGFCAIGTMFAAMAVNTKAREMVLPLLFLPMVSPIIISAVKASGLSLAGEGWGAMSSWLMIIIAFDVIFIVASYLVFPFVVEE